MFQKEDDDNVCEVFTSIVAWCWPGTPKPLEVGVI
jgi:hypothetical protein